MANANYIRELSNEEVNQLANILQDTGLGIGDGLEKMGIPIRDEFKPLSRRSFDKLSELIFYCHPCKLWLSVVEFNDKGIHNRCRKCLEEDQNGRQPLLSAG